MRTFGEAALRQYKGKTIKGPWFKGNESNKVARVKDNAIVAGILLGLPISRGHEWASTLDQRSGKYKR